MQVEVLKSVFQSLISSKTEPSKDMPWNNNEIIAPNLLSLAKNGTIITDMYVQPVCTPSRSALMTSRYYPFSFFLLSNSDMVS